ncbi:unnamed protein product [Brassica rapa subsp. narinosa]
MVVGRCLSLPLWSMACTCVSLGFSLYQVQSMTTMVFSSSYLVARLLTFGLCSCLVT